MSRNCHVYVFWLCLYILDMSDRKLLLAYQKDVKSLKQAAFNLNISEDEVNKLFEDCFQKIKKTSDSNHTNNIRSKPKCYTTLSFIIKVLLIFFIICIFLLTILNHHQPTLSLVLRNVQSFIYPGLKILRLLSVPFIKLFPSLSELYDESCLVENPYFQVTNMECWPCENIHSVINLTGFKNYSLYQSGVPYVLKTLDKRVFLSTIQELYANNSVIFDKDSRRITSNKPYLKQAKDLLNLTAEPDTHVTWRINRMEPSRFVRKIFPRPHVVSQWSGQSTERFLIIDQYKAGPYVLPNPECSNVFLTQGSGERTIILRPSLECSGSCRTISILLKPTYSLWYNWWYWKPVSLPKENSSDVSIMYLSSYC